VQASAAGRAPSAAAAALRGSAAHPRPPRAPRHSTRGSRPLAMLPRAAHRALGCGARRVGGQPHRRTRPAARRAQTERLAHEQPPRAESSAFGERMTAVAQGASDSRARRAARTGARVQRVPQLVPLHVQGRCRAPQQRRQHVLRRARRLGAWRARARLEVRARWGRASRRLRSLLLVCLRDARVAHRDTAAAALAQCILRRSMPRVWRGWSARSVLAPARLAARTRRHVAACAHTQGPWSQHLPAAPVPGPAKERYSVP